MKFTDDRRLRWKKCPSRIPDAPKVHAEESILTHFWTEGEATTLDDRATAVFVDLPDGEQQPDGPRGDEVAVRICAATISGSATERESLASVRKT